MDADFLLPETAFGCPPSDDEPTRSAFVPRVSPRGRPYLFNPETKWVRVEVGGRATERGSFGAADPGTLADRWVVRLRYIGRLFGRARTIVERSAHFAMVPGYLRKLEELHDLWTTKGAQWRNVKETTDYATRRFRLSGDAKVVLRELLLNAQIAGDTWAIESAPRSSRRALHIRVARAKLYAQP